MKSFQTSLFGALAFLVVFSAIAPVFAQRTVVKTETNGCRRYSDGSIDCRR